ncbi:hypothetical protein FRX31_026726, partial [Thalictrum thalictroides]
MAWKILHKAINTEDRVQAMMVSMPSQCVLCKVACESWQHLFFDCKVAKNIWSILSEWFLHARPPDNMDKVINLRASKSPMLADMWKSGSLAVLVQIWIARNKMRYENVQPKLNKMIFKIKKAVDFAQTITKKHSFGNQYDQLVFGKLKVKNRNERRQRIVECYWLPPTQGQMKANTDGASLGNPGQAGWGVVYRDHLGAAQGAYIGGLGRASNYEAECTAIVECMDMALSKGWDMLWV